MFQKCCSGNRFTKYLAGEKHQIWQSSLRSWERHCPLLLPQEEESWTTIPSPSWLKPHCSLVSSTTPSFSSLEGPLYDPFLWPGIFLPVIFARLVPLICIQFFNQYLVTPYICTSFPPLHCDVNTIIEENQAKWETKCLKQNPALEETVF